MVKATLAVLGATLSFGPAHGAFTLTRARLLAVRYEQRAGINGQVQGCRWHGDHAVLCAVIGIESPITGAGSAMFRWQDEITRSGACALPVTKRTGPHSGFGRGTTAGHSHNCFTGPLVVLHAGDLQQIS